MVRRLSALLSLWGACLVGATATAFSSVDQQIVAEDAFASADFAAFLILIQLRSSADQASSARNISTPQDDSGLHHQKTSLFGEAAVSVRAPRYFTADWKTGRQKLVFVHIPKNAGTGIEEAGARGHIWWPRKWLSFWHGVKMPDNSMCEKYHVPPHILNEMKEPDAEVFKEDGTFCVVRNPYERVVSEYLYMLHVPWGPSMSDLYDTGLLDDPACSEKGLNGFVQRALLKVKSGKRYIHDCHFVPQVDFIWGKNSKHDTDDGTQYCQTVLRAENLEEGFNSLMERNGYNVSMRRELANNTTKQCPGLGTEALTQETRRMIDDVYSEDFLRLGYNQSRPPLTFMHIPHNAGTAIEDAAHAAKVEYPRRQERFGVRMPMSDFSWCERYHVPPRHLPEEEMAIFKESDVFCVTRHPYDRVLSAYNFVASSKEAQKMADWYDTGVLSQAGPICSAHSLNYFLQRMLTRISIGQKFVLDCRMVPQAEFIWGADGEEICNIIIKDDELPGAFNNLMAQDGYPDISISSTRWLAGQWNHTCDKLSAVDFDKNTLELIHSVYADDFTKLGYE